MSQESFLFDGKNILPRLPEDLARVVAFLAEKEAEGSFVYSTSVLDWSDVVELIETSFNFGYKNHLYAYAVGLAYIATQSNGLLQFPEQCNEWNWASALLTVAPISGWNAHFMARVVNSFHERDGIEHVLGNAVQAYCRSSFENGLLMLEELPSYRNSIFAGLMEDDYHKICSLFPLEENQDLYTNAFVQTVQMPQEEICELYDATKAFSPFNSKEAMFFLLTALGGLNEGRKVDCENRILALLQNNTSVYVSPICNWAIRQPDPGPLYERIILALIKGLGKDDKEAYLKTVDQTIAFRDKNNDFLKKVIMSVSETHSPLDVLVFENSLRTLSEDKEVFQSLVISFIIHPKGLYRIVGRRLWDDYHMESSSFDPASMTDDLQSIFIVFMLQDFGNPETRLPKIVPLFNSKSKMVLGTLVSHLRPYTDEYMGHVINAIDNAGINTDLTRKFKKYVDDRETAIEKRLALKELSPQYAQYEVYREATRTQNEYFKRRMDEVEKERESDSFWGMLKNQVLARGGGIRKEDGTTQHLIPIRVSVPSRIMEQSMMPLDRIKWEEELLKDYESKAGDC